MSDKTSPPTFEDFARWTASKFAPSTKRPSRYAESQTAARDARDATLTAIRKLVRPNIEVLKLWAAASEDDKAPPAELTTARGFRVTLAYDEAQGTEGSSICVLVQSPRELLPAIENRTAYLWYGTERFELGQFDADGKAMGILPAGVQFSMSDFTSGRLKLEEPEDPGQD